ncbi:hypothetical protein Rsub_04787 [Raphidocelis subcapitata]|uniref:MSP domain-containing protein n=1 Tax=Raphidocelis subcapitata TaxID=307507 RepID=A0A2V0NTX3_9CHLO|nr:hypothetical protein Rsub_04787 [Raphidocelis subcapitata]|eukprot:GBF91118.1 hypothetical protein Rsub_04787 [Raphidocelis subcapitata]
MTRIQSPPQGGNLLIPLHGYPSANAPSLPRRLDFGRVPVGEPVTRALPLACRAPLAFDFSVRVVKPSGAFSVAPAAGVVPARGAAEVLVTFRPTAFETEEFRFEVTVAEFGAKPMVCTAVGSAAPGAARDRALEASGLLGSDGAAGPGPAGGSSDGSGSDGGGGGWSGGGGGGGARGDGFSRRLAAARRRASRGRDCRRDGPIPGALPRLAPPNALMGVGPGDEVAAGDGTRVPAVLRGHADVAYVLNQQEGKLRTKDAAITKRRAELAERERALERLSARCGVGALDDPFLPPALKAGRGETLRCCALRCAERSRPWRGAG